MIIGPLPRLDIWWLLKRISYGDLTATTAGCLCLATSLWNLLILYSQCDKDRRSVGFQLEERGIALHRIRRPRLQISIRDRRSRSSLCGDQIVQRQLENSLAEGISARKYVRLEMKEGREGNERKERKYYIDKAGHSRWLITTHHPVEIAPRSAISTSLLLLSNLRGLLSNLILI